MEIGDILSICIAGTSFIFSTAVSIWNIFLTKRIQRINMQAEHTKNVYSEYLFGKLPKSRAEISFIPKDPAHPREDHSIEGAKELAEVVRTLLSASLFFKLIEPAFYEKLREYCNELDTYLNNCINDTYASDEKIESTKKSIDEKLARIYQLIYDQYRGEKVKTKQK